MASEPSAAAAVKRTAGRRSARSRRSAPGAATAASGAATGAPGAAKGASGAAKAPSGAATGGPGDASATRSILVALAANVAIAIAKFIGAAISGSGALLAEGLHSLADTGNETLLLWGRREARRAPTAKHPMGYGRATYFWSFIVALLLFSAGGIVSIVEGAHKLRTGSSVESPWVAIGILLFALGADGFSQIITLRTINERRGGISLWRWLRETRHSELLVVFAEDVAGVAGVLIAIAAIGATMITGNPMWDAIGSIAIGALLVLAAMMLGNEIKSLLIGESASPRMRRAILRALEADDRVDRVVHMISSQHGASIVLGIKARMKGRLSGAEMIVAIDGCESALRERFPEITWIFFEPV